MKISELELRGKLYRKEAKWQHVKHKLDQEVQEGHLQLENGQKALNEEIAHMNENLTVSSPCTWSSFLYVLLRRREG